MASVPYGSYFYGRSRYGTPGYHFAASDIDATAGINAPGTLDYTLLGPITAAQTTGASIQGNHIFQASGTFSGSSSMTAEMRRVRLGVPLTLQETSGNLTHGTQVDQAETFINPISGHSATGNQIDQGSVSIQPASTSTQAGLQIDLGATNISGTSSQTASGLQIDLGQVNPFGTSSAITVGTQIDLGATTDINETSNVLTLNPIYSIQDIDIYVVNSGGQNKFSPYTNLSPGAPITLTPGFTINLLQDDTSNAGHPIYLSAVQNGTHNTSIAHISLRKDANGTEFLQIQGSATSSANPGGTASDERRTLYIYNSDTSGQAPTYSGSQWPYIFPKTVVTKDPQVTATIGSVTVGGAQVLTVNGYPAYQYSGDSSPDTANGVSSQWKALTNNGTSHTTAKSGDFVYDSIFWIGSSYVGTAGQPGSYLTVNNITGTTQTLYYFCRNHSGMGGTALIGTTVQGIEAVYSISESSTINSESGLTSFGIRKYFLESALSSSSSISSDGGIKWQEQSAPATSWTEQKIARTP